MRLRRGFRGWWIALLAALADRLTKALVSRLPGRGTPLIPGVVDILTVKNSGIAFSMLSGRARLLALFTAVLIAGLIAWLATHPDAPALFRAGLWLIAGGGLGNLYDRLTAGSVLDFIRLRFVRFAVFNVADICICLGAALAVIGGTLAQKRDSAPQKETRT